MSRAHSSFPAKSNAFTIPVPVIVHTVRPSVTGDGDDMFCFWSLTLPAPSLCFQTGAPVPRSIAHKNSSEPSATFRKTRSPHTIGVDPDHAGRPIFQVMFSVFVQRSGTSFSPLTPLRNAPRHCGQFSADT